jgi:hypothetical protein
MPESYLENALAKLAHQLVAFDEASLMDLWEKYAEIVRQFEPTRRWEEAAVIFGMIQSVRMKNQLFNYNLAASRRADPFNPAGSQADGFQPDAGRPGGPGSDLLGLTAPEPRAQQRAGARQEPRGGRPEAQEKRGPGGAVRGSVRQGGKPKAGKLIPLRRGED